MRTDEKMLLLLEENSRMTGNTKADEVRIAIEERNKRLKEEK
jgi:DNA-binding Lrp family transcriptional regulator